MKLLLVCLLLGGLQLGCQQSSVRNRTCQRRPVALSVNNDSFIDTLAQARIILNDSLLVQDSYASLKTGSEYWVKDFSVCPGRHTIHVDFGRYQRDTVLLIQGNQSLMVSMNHDTIRGLEFNNGIAIALINHDEAWRNRID